MSNTRMHNGHFRKIPQGLSSTPHCTTRRGKFWGRSEVRLGLLTCPAYPGSGSISSLLPLRVQNTKETEQTHHKVNIYSVLLSPCFYCVLKLRNSKQTWATLYIYRCSFIRHTLKCCSTLKKKKKREVLHNFGIIYWWQRWKKKKLSLVIKVNARKRQPI